MRTFVSLLALRVSGGIEEEPWRNYELPGGLTVDQVALSLIAQADEDDRVGQSFGMDDDTPDDDLREIVDCIKEMLNRSPPSSN